MTLVHLHNHTEYSALDGLTTPAEAAARAASAGQPALAITDHGMCAGHPHFQRACDAEGVKPVFGIETYFYPDRREKVRDNRHLILLAMDQQGLHDLWALSTEAWVTGKYHNPRCDWELLERYGSHLIATTSCLGGIISPQLLAGDSPRAAERLMRLHGIFGDRLYLEIQGNQLPDQIRLNKILVEVSKGIGIPLIAASDAHYPTPDKHELHKLWMSCQTSPANDGYWNYIHAQTEEEMRAALAYLEDDIVEEAIRNTALIAEQCNARVEGAFQPPVFLGSHEEDNRRLLDLCFGYWAERLAHVPVRDHRIYYDRLEREFRLITDKHLAGCYLMVQDALKWARSQGALVGPGRGSAAGSLVSYLITITSMDPIRTGLLFERFLTPGRVALPDFDMDLPSSFREPLQNYMINKYGASRVVKVGTHMRYRNKGILNKLFSVMRPDAEDAPKIAAIIEEAESHTAGLGLRWDELMDESGDQLQPYIERWMSVFEAAAQLVGRLNSYGQHPAGLVVSTDAELSAMLPMRLGERGHLISQFDFRDMEALGLFKLDFLTIRTLDSIQGAIRLIERRTGQPPDPPRWEAEHDDPQAWEEIQAGNTVGMFQIETSLCKDLCYRMKPATIAELAALIALVRPGPRNSGMTESYLRRKRGDEPVSYPHPLLETALKDTYGLMIYQENILATCRVLAGYDDAEADGVRKILGKKLKDKVEAAGKVFVDRCQKNGVNPDDAADLWRKMAEFGKYAFNLAHAYSYATLSYWTAWLKAHYPVEAITAILSTLDKKDRMAMYAIDARRMGIGILPPDVRFSGAGFEAEGISIRYGLSSVKSVGAVAIRGIVAGQPYSDLDDFRKRSAADSGVVYALARAGALDPFVFSRRSLVTRLEADRSGESTRCAFKDEKGAPPLLCSFDWENEPREQRISERTGRPLKLKILPPPKRCTVACRQYLPPALSPGDLPEYGYGELWRTENDVYGTWMTPAAFAALDKLQPGLRAHSRGMADLVSAAPRGYYPLAAVHDGLHSAITRRGSVMWWLRLATEISAIDVAVFSPRNDDDPDLASTVRYLRRGTLVLAMLAKDAYLTPAGSWRTSWRLNDLIVLG